MPPKSPLVIHWFRRDLRLHDNAGLYHALRSGNPVLCLFIFDKNILDKLEDRSDKRVLFIHRQIQKLQQELSQYGSSLLVKTGKPQKVWEELLAEYTIAGVFTNNDYEPYALSRDQEITTQLQKNNISFHSFKDQVILEKDEVLKDDGKPYTVYTPYSRKWLSKITPDSFHSFPNEKHFDSFYKIKVDTIPSLESLGFHSIDFPFPPAEVSIDLLEQYAKQRDFPSLPGTSRLSVHLRFGTVSIRELAKKGQQHAASWLNELCWREFYMQILYHFPHVTKGCFKPAYDHINWRNNEQEFAAWCSGNTGYPIVDAGMRELNTTGFMHNRVRMIVASFLTKHLLIDWRWGEAYFAAKLLDFDLSANNGGWQWAAGSGCDAAPYFRIFNPYEQTKKFDADMQYIRKWVPEFEDFSYPKPIVDHKQARERCLATYAKALVKG